MSYGFSPAGDTSQLTAIMATFPLPPTNLSGTVLLAHPGLVDPNFSRTVVLVSSHSEEEGAVGAIINRPLDKTLGECDEAFAFDPLGKIQVYRGGPVRPDEVILAAWNWREQEGVFRLLYGIDTEQARLLLADDDFEVRAFLGYAGWEQGQLEGELTHHSWLVGAIGAETFKGDLGSALWRDLIVRVNPEMKFLADAPEDPSVN